MILILKILITISIKWNAFYAFWVEHLCWKLKRCPCWQCFLQIRIENCSNFVRRVEPNFCYWSFQSRTIYTYYYYIENASLWSCQHIKSTWILFTQYPHFHWNPINSLNWNDDDVEHFVAQNFLNNSNNANFQFCNKLYLHFPYCIVEVTK